MTDFIGPIFEGPYRVAPNYRVPARVRGLCGYEDCRHVIEWDSCSLLARSSVRWLHLTKDHGLTGPTATYVAAS